MISNAKITTGLFLALCLLLPFTYCSRSEDRRSPSIEQGNKEPADADTLVKNAYNKAEEQRYSESIRLYDAAVAVSPKRGDIFAARGGLLAVMGDYKRAVADWEQAVALGGSEYDASYRRP